MIHILGVAPYEGLKKVMEEIVTNYENVNLDIIVGDLEIGVKKATKQLKVKNYDAIISRGGTAQLLRKFFYVPVIDIGVSQYDIVQIIQLSNEYKGKKAIVGFQSITRSAHKVSDALQYDISIFTINSGDEALPLLNNLKEQGFSIILSDMINTKIAKSIGLNTLLITSSSESVEQSINYAIQLTNTVNQSNQILKYYSSIFLDGDESMIVFNKDDYKLEYCFNIDKSSPLIIKVKKTELLEDTNSSKQIIIEFENNFYILKRISYQIANKEKIIFFIKKHCYFNSTAIEGIVTKNIINLNNQSYDDFYKIVEDKAFHNKISSFSKKNEVILIIGESGVGKSYTAQYIHTQSNYKNSIFYEFDCQIITEKLFFSLINNINSPLFENGNTLFFKNINCLPYKKLLNLIVFITETSLNVRNKIIFSYQNNDLSKTTDDNSENSIFNIINGRMTILTLYLAPLREKNKFISNLATVYINKLNRHNEKQILGFNNGVADLLQNYSWPDNYLKFKKVLKQLFYLTESSYISYELTNEILQEERTILTVKESAVPLNDQKKDYLEVDIDQSLDEIIKEVVNKVLEENKMNKTKTAKKLGIGRSTLWRILNS